MEGRGREGIRQERKKERNNYHGVFPVEVADRDGGRSGHFRRAEGN
jgi:hypothetical protein